MTIEVIFSLHSYIIYIDFYKGCLNESCFCAISALVTYVSFYLSLGHCTEFNSLGVAIQEHFTVKCSDVKPPCNKSYLSTDAYLCKCITFDHTLFLSNGLNIL